MKTVLLVEDNQDDVLLMKLACACSGVPHDLDVVVDGDAAIHYLAGTGAYVGRALQPLPDLVFLDVNLPGRTGLGVLEWIRSRPELKNMPVIMLTVSGERSDAERAYKLGVTSYLLKSANSQELKEAMQIILKYWLQMNVSKIKQRAAPE